MDWQQHAAALADEVCDPRSRWHALVAETPRHPLLPRWWEAPPDGEWKVRDGASGEDAWMATAYSDESVVTEVAGHHADHADGEPLSRYAVPTSSSTLPSLVVSTLRYARLYDGCDLLDIGTGAGYSTALAAKRLGDRHVTSIDINPYVTREAASRLARMGLYPDILHVDGTGDLPGTYDRILAMTGVWPVPASWLKALRHQGRFATTLAGTSLFLTADIAESGEYAAVGRIEWEPAGFMIARTGGDTGTALRNIRVLVDDMTGGQTETGRYPVVNVAGSRELRSLMQISVPGVRHDYQQGKDGSRAAWMLGADGSWARAVAAAEHEPPKVTQGGPSRLWDILDGHRDRWVSRGYLPLYGAKAFVRADGTVRLQRGDWSAEIK